MKYLIIIAALSFNLFATFDHSHQPWEELLKKYVIPKPDFNRFKYTALQKNKKDRKILNHYLKDLSAVPLSEYNKFSDNEKLAYLINAYNAYTIDVVFSRYPYVDSIRDIGVLSLGPWRRENIKLLGKMMSLHQIEKDNLIDKFNEPRIHFAVNCASIGCPSLQPFAFTANNLEKQFVTSAKDFIYNETKNKFVESKNELQLSKIFEWYGYDFEEKYGSVKKYLAPKLAEGNKSLEKKILNAKVVYKDYDWKLNK